MITLGYTIIISEIIDHKALKIDFSEIGENYGSYEESKFNELIESGPIDIAHFAGPDGYYAQVLIGSDRAALIVPDKLYSDSGFQDLIYSLKTEGVKKMNSDMLGYDLIMYKKRG